MDFPIIYLLINALENSGLWILKILPFYGDWVRTFWRPTRDRCSINKRQRKIRGNRVTVSLMTVSWVKLIRVTVFGVTGPREIVTWKPVPWVTVSRIQSDSILSDKVSLVTVFRQTVCWSDKVSWVTDLNRRPPYRCPEQENQIIIGGLHTGAEQQPSTGGLQTGIQAVGCPANYRHSDDWRKFWQPITSDRPISN